MRVIASDVEPNGPAAEGGVILKDVFVEVDGERFDDGKPLSHPLAMAPCRQRTSHPRFAPLFAAARRYRSLSHL